MAFTDSSGIGPLLGSAAPDYFQPVEQAPSHMTRALASRPHQVKPVCAILWAIRARTAPLDTGQEGD